MNLTPKMHNKSVGKLGEDIANKHLLETGFDVLDRNYASRWGEIDIIAKKDGVLVFVEVKTKIGDKYGKPWEAVTFYKYQKLQRSIQYYLKAHNLNNQKCRVDVIGVLLNTDKTLKELKVYEGR